MSNAATIKQLKAQLEETQVKLKHTEEMFLGVLEGSMAGYWDWHIQDEYEYLSPMFKKMFGYEDHELPNHPDSWQKIIHPDDLPGVFKVFDAHVNSKGKIPYTNIVRYMHKDGSIVWVQCNGKVIEWDDDFKPLRMVGSHVDITKIKLAEEKLRKENIAQQTASAWELERANTFLNSILDNVPQLIFVKNADDLTYRLINKSCQDSIGMTEPQIIGKKDSDIFPKELVDAIIESDRRVIDNGETLDIPRESVITQNQGERIYRTRKIPMLDARGNVEYLLGVSEDITEREQIEYALTESQKRFQLVVEASGSGIWDWINVNEDQEWWSPRFYVLLGYKDKEIEASVQNFRNMLHPDDHDHTFAAVNNHFQNDVPFNVQYRLKSKSGKYRWFNSIAVVERNEQGQAVRMIGSITDIHKEKITQLALTKKTKALVRSNKELEQFAYIASHDLQSPLRTISSFLMLLKNHVSGKIDSEADEFMDFAIKGAEHMKSLIDGLLDYARVGANLDFQTVDLANLLRKTLSYINEQLEENQANVSMDPLPTIKGDPTQMSRLFQNLIENALKFRRDIPPEIYIGCLERDNDYLFSISDNGIGIDNRFLERVFAVFQRLNKQSEYKGTGIGLAICKRIVEEHGGKIWVESEKNAGSTFYFTVSKHIHSDSESFNPSQT